MKIYDKAKWHIEGGEDSTEVINKFKVVFSFLKSENFLTDEGLEVFDLGIDTSISLHERLLNVQGNNFLSNNYDKVINFNSDKIGDELKKLL